MRIGTDERGQVLVITAVCIVAFIGFIGLSVDVGALFYSKRQMQAAADAAATAAAIEYLHSDYVNSFASAKSAAITAGANAAATNDVGFGSALSAAVSVNTNSNSPAAHQGCSGSTCYFEAIITKQNPTVFYNAFLRLWKGSGSGNLTVAARAVAGTPGVSQNCGFLTASSGTALTVKGNWKITASCGLYINSSSNAVEDDTGGAAKSGIDAPSIELVGPAPNDITKAPGTAAVITQVLPQTIPFENIPAPAVPGTCTTVSGGSLTGSLQPGCYSYSGKNPLTIGSATMAAGTYIFTGDVTINGKLTGTGVTIDMNSGSLTVKPGNSSMNISAPTSGTYNGILIYQPTTNRNTLNMEAGSSSGTFSGYIYAPSATFSMQDNGGGLSVSGLVVKDIDNGPAALTITGYSASTSPLKVVSLVE
ncbi:MAG TPA: pilus assembly protein TadG-related protein [Acidobacteriaceae bacterium]|nr:pilus assembly protein TadG-related protein [Acidobacteriaceae bacterium]